MCVEESEMPYDDGAQTTQTNAVNDTLKDIQKMVDIVKRDGEVSLSYMKGFERDTIMYEKG